MIFSNNKKITFLFGCCLSILFEKVVIGAAVVAPGGQQFVPKNPVVIVRYEDYRKSGLQPGRFYKVASAGIGPNRFPILSSEEICMSQNHNGSTLEALFPMQEYELRQPVPPNQQQQMMMQQPQMPPQMVVSQQSGVLRVPVPGVDFIPPPGDSVNAPPPPPPPK